MSQVSESNLADFGKKRITDHDFSPPLKMWGRKIKIQKFDTKSEDALVN